MIYYTPSLGRKQQILLPPGPFIQTSSTFLLPVRSCNCLYLPSTQQTYFTMTLSPSEMTLRGPKFIAVPAMEYSTTDEVSASCHSNSWVSQLFGASCLWSVFIWTPTRSTVENELLVPNDMVFLRREIITSALLANILAPLTVRRRQHRGTGTGRQRRRFFGI